MQYIIRTPEGAEYGPADEATLIKWAGAGRIKADFEIRNEVMRKWHTAAETPFLKNVLRDRELEEKTTMGKKFGSFVNPTAELGSGQASNSLTNSGVFKWTNANAGRRLASFLFDAFVVAAIFWGLTFSLDLFPFKQAYLCYTLAGILISLAYFSLALGFMAQTLGQLFWGVMVIRKDGEPVLLGRAYLFTVLSWLTLPLTPILTYSTRSHRGLAERMTGVVVCRTRVMD